MPREYVTEIKYDKLIEHLQQITHIESIKKPKANAGEVFTVAYACYARIGEVVGHKFNLDFVGIRGEDMSVSDLHIRFNVLTEKLNKRRTVYVSRRKEPVLCEMLLRIKERLGDRKWFCISHRWCEYKFKEYFPDVLRTENVHLLRHWAATHYLEGFKTVGRPSVEQLKLLGGWKRTSTVYDVYAHLHIESSKGEI